MPSPKLDRKALEHLIDLAKEWHHGCPCCGCWIATLKDVEPVAHLALSDNQRTLLAGAMAVEAKKHAR